MYCAMQQGFRSIAYRWPSNADDLILPSGGASFQSKLPWYQPMDGCAGHVRRRARAGGSIMDHVHWEVIPRTLANIITAWLRTRHRSRRGGHDKLGYTQQRHPRR